jgi:DNA-binding transcriptional ArsR family regulator
MHGWQAIKSLRNPNSCPACRRSTSAQADKNLGAPETVDHQIVEALRAEIRKSQEKSTLFGRDTAGAPAWNILLDLYLASITNRCVTVSNSCVASGAPQTTALRWIDVLESMRLVERSKSELDRRVIFLQLTAAAEAKLKAYFSEC